MWLAPLTELTCITTLLLLSSTTGNELFINRATSRENHLFEYIDNPSREGTTLDPSFDDSSTSASANVSILNTGFISEAESTEVEVY